MTDKEISKLVKMKEEQGRLAVSINAFKKNLKEADLEIKEKQKELKKIESEKTILLKSFEKREKILKTNGDNLSEENKKLTGEKEILQKEMEELKNSISSFDEYKENELAKFDAKLVEAKKEQIAVYEIEAEKEAKRKARQEKAAAAAKAAVRGPRVVAVAQDQNRVQHRRRHA